MFMPAASARIATTASVSCSGWPAWEAFRQQFVSADGRVVDPFGSRRVTTSEGQAYSMFFALVANDRAAFDLALQWTQNNLAAGDLRARLPAWQWGQRDDGRWDVIDSNAASDADLWMVYSLSEASRLWHDLRYRELAVALADRVLAEETAVLGSLGRVLLPGPQGFGPWPQGDILPAVLNPSYLPLPVMRWLSQGAMGQADAWRDVLASSLRVLGEGAPKGLAADWLVALASTSSTEVRWVLDNDKGSARASALGAARADPDAPTGSYNAIRVYLWLGITDAADPARQQLLERYAPMADLTVRLGVPPESVDPDTGAYQGAGPPGFSAAMLPYVDALGRLDAKALQLQRLATDPLRADAYYEQALALFAFGHREGFYRFDAKGYLLPRWDTCAGSTVSAR